jgi:prepilin-type N-terminal cleavage/methylation domain-containing protein
LVELVASGALIAVGVERDLYKKGIQMPAHSTGKYAYGTNRKGFTLVEVIVVIVIMAILAAIGAPSLTGYIKRTQDKEWGVKARNLFVAYKTLFAESYAAGELDGASAVTYINDGLSTNPAYTKYWTINAISDARSVNVANSSYLATKAGEIAGVPYESNVGLGGSWRFYPVGPPGSTALTADGFFWIYYPEGYVIGKDTILVTYKIEPLNVPASAEGNNAIFVPLTRGNIYSADTGLMVYHYKRR